jgi:hypothetical protein
MENYMKKYLLLIILLCSALSINAQRKPVAKPKPIATPQPTATPDTPSAPVIVKVPENLKKELFPEDIIYSDSPFGITSLEWSKVPLNFYGNDFSKLYALLLTSFKAKDEFETTEAYQKRIAEGAERVLTGKLSANSLMAFRYDLTDKSIDFSAKYNADKQVLSVVIESKLVSVLSFDNSLKSGYGIPTKDAELNKLGTYEGQNAYGAKKEVEKSELNQYLFTFNNIREFKPFLSDNDISLELSLPPEQAREAKSNLSYLLITRLSKPYAGIDVDRLTPKIDNPVDVTSFKRYLSGRIEEIWIYNRKTGEIYQKLKAIPITTGDLRISSIVRNDGFLLLDKSMIDILTSSNLAPIDKTKSGGVYDLLQTLIKASKKESSGKYLYFRQQFASVTEKHIVRTIQTDSFGNAKIENLPFGTYYLFGGWSDYSGTYVWNKAVTIDKETQDISLSSYNADYR